VIFVVFSSWTLWLIDLVIYSHIISNETCSVILERVTADTFNGCATYRKSIFGSTFRANAYHWIWRVNIDYYVQAVCNIVVRTGAVISVEFFNTITDNDSIPIISSCRWSPVVCTGTDCYWTSKYTKTTKFRIVEIKAEIHISIRNYIVLFVTWTNDESKCNRDEKKPYFWI